MTELPPPEPEIVLAPIVRHAKDHSTSGRWFMGLGVFLLGIASAVAVLITIPGLRNNGDATRATREELACRAVSQVGLETARAELQRGQAQWAEALGSYLVASEDVLRTVIAGTPDPVVDATVITERKRFEAASVDLKALDAPLEAAIDARDAAITSCDPHTVGAETP